MSRLTERMHDRIRLGQNTQAAILLVVGLIVVFRLLTYALTTFYLLEDDFEAFRNAQLVGTAFAAVLDIILVILVWMLFEAIRRIDRESERVQAFMDNVYRKMLER